MRNIIIYSDGTGQRGGRLFDERRSNVYKLFRATRCGPDSSVDPAKQLAFYDPGLGTAPPGHEGSGLIATAARAFYNLVSQATGLGLTHNIIDCYAAIIRLWQPGDRLFLFGFSRGAYTVRCLSAVLCLCGVPVRDKAGNPLPRDPKTSRRIASEAVKKVYQHTESRKITPTDRDKELLAQRELLGHRFRETYGSAEAADPSKANVYPFFIGVFDAVASLAKPFVAVCMFFMAVLLTAIPAWIIAGCLGYHPTFWHWFIAIASIGGVAALISLFVSLVRFEFKLPRKLRLRFFHLTKIHIELYETDLSNDIVKARHALSIDECRKSFPRVEWGGSYTVSKNESGWFQQVWFAGNHSDIGGSYPENESRLSDISLQWMLEEAVTAGLQYDPSVLKLYPDLTGPQHDETQSSVFRFAPRVLRHIPNEAPLHPSVLERFKAAEVLQYNIMKPYRPENLHNHSAVKHYYQNL
jgi:uncharacterized protein (DUF2235 family)